MLVPQHSLPSPLDKKLTQLDEEMKTVLDRTDLTDFEKASVYSEILDKYLDVKRKLQQPQPIPIVEEQPKTSGQTKVDLQLFPQNYRTRAQNLLTHARNQAGIDWNQKGEILVNGNLIPGSHVVDLIDNTIRYKKGIQRDTPGTREFVKALMDSNVPQALIGNKSRLNDGNSSFATSTPVRSRSPSFESPIPTPSRIKVGRLPKGHGYKFTRTPQRGRGGQWQKW
jgi:hypothetical protein